MEHTNIEHIETRVKNIELNLEHIAKRNKLPNAIILLLVIGGIFLSLRACLIDNEVLLDKERNYILSGSKNLAPIVLHKNLPSNAALFSFTVSGITSLFHVVTSQPGKETIRKKLKTFLNNSGTN